MVLGKNFNHIIQNQKQDGHVLVTEGVYALVRHPAYTGWFCWSISTQVSCQLLLLVFWCWYYEFNAD